jgi:hypothetical protein
LYTTIACPHTQSAIMHKTISLIKEGTVWVCVFFLIISGDSFLQNVC